MTTTHFSPFFSYLTKLLPSFYFLEKYTSNNHLCSYNIHNRHRLILYASSDFRRRSEAEICGYVVMVGLDFRVSFSIFFFYYVNVKMKVLPQTQVLWYMRQQSKVRIFEYESEVFFTSIQLRLNISERKKKQKIFSMDFFLFSSPQARR